jgi:uncharacterized protein (TIGR03067 family)
MAIDLDELQGRWRVTSLEVDGQRMTSAGGATIEIKRDRFASVEMGTTYRGSVQLDPSAEPKAIDLIFETAPEGRNRNLGIYTLEGDRWTICLARQGGTRPTTFATSPGNAVALETLERVSRRKPRRRPAHARRAGVGPPRARREPAKPSLAGRRGSS